MIRLKVGLKLIYVFLAEFLYLLEYYPHTKYFPVELLTVEETSYPQVGNRRDAGKLLCGFWTNNNRDALLIKNVLITRHLPNISYHISKSSLLKTKLLDKSRTDYYFFSSGCVDSYTFPRLCEDYSTTMSRDAEKEALGTHHVDDASGSGNSLGITQGTTQADVDADEEFSYTEQRKIIHRIDRRLVTICGLAYCISLMDRTNLSNAAIAGFVAPR